MRSGTAGCRCELLRSFSLEQDASLESRQRERELGRTRPTRRPTAHLGRRNGAGKAREALSTPCWPPPLNSSVAARVAPGNPKDIGSATGFRPPVATCLREDGDLKVGEKWAHLAVGRGSPCQTVKPRLRRLRWSEPRNVKNGQLGANAWRTVSIARGSQVQILSARPM